MRIALISLFFIVLKSASAQVVFDFSRIDSTIIKIYDHVSKEMTLGDEREHQIMLIKKTVPPALEKAIFKFLSKTNNFSKNRALLTHQNIRIVSYTAEQEVLEVYISSLTRNIFIHYDTVDLSHGISNKGVKAFTKILDELELSLLIEDDFFFPK